MDILFFLVPLSVLLALAVMGVLAWAVWSGQFEELAGEAQRILEAELDAPSYLPIGVPIDAPIGAPIDASLIHVNTLNKHHQHT